MTTSQMTAVIAYVDQKAKNSPRRKAVVLTPADRRNGVGGLRYDAYMAFLDGRTKRAKELNRKADLLEREGKSA